MPLLTVDERVRIAAPVARCFALSTRVELVQRTLGMKMVGGVTSGHITANSRVHWRGLKFGLPTEHHTLITDFSAPHAGHVGDLAAQFDGQQVAWFEDSQEQGRFASFRHVHLFREEGESTFLEDHVLFTLPFGFVGRFIGKIIMAPYIAKLARQRFAMIKALAEGDGWREWVNETSA